MANIGLGLLQRPLRFLRRQLPPLNFITIHYAYFISTCLVSAIILWGAATPARSLHFIDALFLATSAMTLAGLNTVNLSTLNTFQQFWLFFLIMIGSAIFVSAFVVQIRRAAFEKKFTDYAVKARQRSKRGRSWSRGRGWSLQRKNAQPNQDEDTLVDHRKRDTGSPETDLEKTAVSSRTEVPPVQSGTPQMNDFVNAIGDQPNEEVANKDLDMPLPSRSSGVHFKDDTHFEPLYGHYRTTSTHRRRQSMFSMQGVGARPPATLEPISQSTTVALSESDHIRDSSALPPKGREDISRYFDSMGGWISRNSQFHGLTEKERERLGGYEYRAVNFLAWLVPAYYILWQLFGCLGCAAWVASKRSGTATANGLDPWWVGAFNAVSAFNNSGMSLLDANMTAFQTGYYLLLTMGLLILAGNTCYPIFLRLIIWCMYRIVQRFEDRSADWRERARTLKFLLDHPRRCYTNLFPARHTWWLLLSVVTLNGIDWAAYEILNIGNEYIEAFPVGVRVVDGFFQALAVRSGGFYIVPIANVRISLQVLYVVMMYISVYPVVITMRNSNVYEERSLGIYAEDEDDGIGRDRPADQPNFLRRMTGHLVTGGAPAKESNRNFVRQQLRAQLAHDAWTIVLALFVIMIIEGGQFERDPQNFSVFNFLFEIVSGYGCVGISVGYPTENYSFCGTWHALSKLVLCGVMLRGRHRGLPVAIDRAVLLPGEEHELAEEDDGRIRLARTMSRGRQDRAETATLATV